MKDFVWAGYFLDYSGYGYLNRTYTKGLIDRGHDIGVEIFNKSNHIDLPSSDVEFFNAMKAPGNCYQGIDTRIVAHLPVKGIPKTRNRIIYTMMETKNVSPEFVSAVNENYTGVWTPTRWQADQFRDAGIRLPVSILPIPVERPETANGGPSRPFAYSVYTKASSAPSEPTGYRYLSVSRWSFRKGFDVLVKAFLRHFKAADNVSLVLFSRHPANATHPGFRSVVDRDLSMLVEEYGSPDSPPVYLCQDIIPESDKWQVYDQGDCFVLPSRGEGFSLPTMEAALSGIPVIIPNHTGFTDYATYENSYLFEVDEYANYDDVPAWNSLYQCDAYLHQEFPLFGDSKIEEVAWLMHHAKHHPDESAIKTIRLQSMIRERYGLRACLDTVEGYLGDIR